MKKIIAVIFILLFSLFLYGKFIEVNNLNINYYTIKNKNIPNSFKELKIVQFSDIFYNPENNKQFNKLIKEINLLNADILI